MLETIESQKSQKVNVGKYTSMALSLISMLLILGIVSRLVSSHIGGLRSEDFWKFFPSLFLLIVVHELLHAAGALFSRNTTFRDIHFGFNIKWLVPYCHCSTPLTVGTYRLVLLLPLIITVPLAFLVLWADPAKWTVFLVGTTVAGCTIDVLMFFKLQSYDKHFIIKDHPSKPCCEVFFSNTDQIEAQEDPASNHLEKGFILADKSTSLFSRFGRHLERLVTLPIPISIGLMALYAFFMDVIVSTFILIYHAEPGLGYHFKTISAEFSNLNPISFLVVHPVLEVVLFVWLPVCLFRLFTSRLMVLVFVSTLVFASVHFFTGLPAFATGIGTGFMLAFSFVCWQKTRTWKALAITFAIHVVHNAFTLAAVMFLSSV